MPIVNSFFPLAKDVHHSCVFEFPDRALRPDAPPPSGDNPDAWVSPYPYDPTSDWDSTDPTKNGVPGSDPNPGMEPAFAGVREIEFNNAIPPYSGIHRDLALYMITAITGPGQYRIGPSTFSALIWDTQFAGFGIHITAPLPVWINYAHPGGFDFPATPIGGVYYIAMCAIVGNAPVAVHVADVMEPTVPPIERVAFTTGLIDFAGCPNIFGGTLSGTTTITSTVLSFVSYTQAASEFRIV